MKLFFLLLSLGTGIAARAQQQTDNAPSYIPYNRFIHLQGTPYTIAYKYDTTKKGVGTRHMLFVNGRDTTRVEYPGVSMIWDIQPVKLDQYHLYKVAALINRKNNPRIHKHIDIWEAPLKLYLLSSDGKTNQQLTPNAFFVASYVVDSNKATIACLGFFDNNANEKLDRKDTKDTLVYDLVSLKQLAGAVR
ncbi:hypothetical protein AB6805_21440 [Chitinophaga sp. RCC_12]|uniref:hypothetical protein n=1 Tax=Chitinophaga sp. RCC_12 TaxID=3239226 RepID=UPI003525289B